MPPLRTVVHTLRRQIRLFPDSFALFLHTAESRCHKRPDRNAQVSQRGTSQAISAYSLSADIILFIIATKKLKPSKNR